MEAEQDSRALKDLAVFERRIESKYGLWSGNTGREIISELLHLAMLDEPS